MRAAGVHDPRFGKTVAFVKRACVRRLAIVIVVLAAALSGPGAKAPSIMAQPSPATISLFATISVGGYPTWVTVNQATNQIYVANYLHPHHGNSMSVIDGATNQVVETLHVGDAPRSIALNPTTNRVYVANTGSGVTVLDAGNNFTPIATIATRGAWHVAVNPTTNVVYLTQPAQNTVAVIDGQTNTVITSVATLAYPTDIAIDSATNDYYISDGQANAVSHINGTTNQVIRSFAVGNAPDRMTYNPNTNQLYVSNPRSHNISVINCATDAVVATIPVNGAPDGIASDGNAVFAVLLTASTGTLLEFDATTNALINSGLPSQGAVGVAVNPQTQMVYTANAKSNTVSVAQVTPLATATSTPSATASPAPSPPVTVTPPPLAQPSPVQAHGGRDPYVREPVKI